MVVFTSCDLLTGGGSITPPAELPAVPASITAEAGVEEVLVTWDASEGATAYSLYFTDDGSAPARSSIKIALGNVTTYTLSNLTWAKSGTEGALSTVSNSIRPIPTIEARFTGGTPNAKMMLMVTPVNLNRSVTPPEFVDLDTGVLYTGFTTDGSGAVNLKAPFNREKSVGYTLMYDVDESNSLTEGDIVQGNGAANTWGIYYWDDLEEESFSFNTTQTTNPWHEYSLVSGD